MEAPPAQAAAHAAAAAAGDGSDGSAQMLFITPEPVPVPAELLGVREHAEAYAEARVRSFAHAFAQQLGAQLAPEAVDVLTAGIMGQPTSPLQGPLPAAIAAAAPEAAAAAAAPGSTRQLQLILHHNCLSSGCGDSNCELCRFNPSRLCRQNLKPKYLIDDLLRAKCGAPLCVQLVDRQQQQLVQQDLVLQVHVLNGEKYKELASAAGAAALDLQQLASCIIMAPPGQKPLLKRETSTAPVGPDPRVFVSLQNGQAPLADLQCTTSSEALLQGKAPTFRLLIWAVDPRTGEPLAAAGPAVSESFVVATKRVKHALKNDIPTVSDDISKLLNVGKATVDKLKDLGRAARAENVELGLPPHLLSDVEKVGQFREIVELTEQSNELKQKLRQLLKFSVEKWDELAQHALAAVLPDFRPRVWWSGAIKGGLLFPGKGGAPQLEQQPLAYVHREAPGSPESVFAIHQLPDLMQLLSGLRERAKQDWLAAGHANWSIYWSDAADPYAKQLQGLAVGPNLAAPIPLGVLATAAMTASGGGAAAAAVAATAAAANRAAHTEEAARSDFGPPAAAAGGVGFADHQQYPPPAAQLAPPPLEQQQQQPQPGLMAPPPPRQPRPAPDNAGAVGSAGLALPQVPVVSLPSPGAFRPQQQQQAPAAPSPFAKTDPGQLLAADAAAAAADARGNGGSDGGGSPRSGCATPKLAGQKRQSRDARDELSDDAAAGFAAQQHQQQRDQEEERSYLAAADVIAPRSDEIVSPVAASGCSGGLAGAPPSLMMLDALNTVDLMQTLNPVELAGLHDVRGSAGLGDDMETSVQWQSLQSLACTGLSLEIGPAFAAANSAGGAGQAGRQGSGGPQQPGQSLGVEGLSLLLSDSLDLTGVKGHA